MFVIASLSHFSRGTIEYAASTGVPWASLLVPVSGALALLGGLSVMFGIKTRVGALLLILFLVPVTFTMHRFWMITDPGLAAMQRVMFFKNLSMLGGAFLLLYYGGGPLSMDALSERRSTR
jgi:putative oxidoreductase